MKGYPITTGRTLEDVLSTVDFITSERGNDILEFDNLKEKFVGGRTTTRVPSSPSDVLPTDKEGDIVSDGTFEFKLIDDSGLVWDRRTLNTSW